eukprot:gene12271-12357_t
MALSVIAMPAVAQAAEGFVSSSGNLRAGPQTTYPRIDHLARGTSLEVYGCLRGYAWCDVSADGERGWFPGSHIQFLRDGRNMNLNAGFGILGLSILDFAQPDYWGSHYSNQPWYGDRRWQRGNDAPNRQQMPGRQPVQGHQPMQNNTPQFVNPTPTGNSPRPQQNNNPAPPTGGSRGNFQAAPAQQQPSRQNNQPQAAPQQQHQNGPQQNQKPCPTGETC